MSLLHVFFSPSARLDLKQRQTAKTCYSFSILNLKSDLINFNVLVHFLFLNVANHVITFICTEINVRYKRKCTIRYIVLYITDLKSEK